LHKAQSKNDRTYTEKDRKGKTDDNGKPVYYPHAKFITKEAVEEVNKLALAKFEEVRGSNGSSGGTTVDELPF